MKTTHQDIHDLKKQYVERLSKRLSWPKAQLWELVHKLWPSIQEVQGEPDDSSETYRVEMSELANIMSAVICGDHNVEFHTKEGGVLQTLPIIGMCSAVTSHFQPGYALTKIEPEITFSEAIPAGAGVELTVKISRGKPGGRMLAFELTGKIEGSERNLFPVPRIITMFKLPDSA